MLVTRDLRALSNVPFGRRVAARGGTRDATGARPYIGRALCLWRLEKRRRASLKRSWKNRPRAPPTVKPSSSSVGEMVTQSAEILRRIERRFAKPGEWSAAEQQTVDALMARRAPAAHRQARTAFPQTVASPSSF